MTQTRTEYLATLPAEQRSEAAARWDHQAEADGLRNSPIAAREQIQARADLSQRALIAALTDGRAIPYDPIDLCDRILRGRVISMGQARVIAEVQQQIAAPTDDQIEAEARRVRTERLEYLAQRYGV